MAFNNSKVAIVVGASRGIGRQVAIDLAKNGYAGKNSCILSYSMLCSSNTFCSCGCSKINFGRVRYETLPTSSELSTIDN